ncbi:MAG: glycosyltransferase, partial [Acidimicrobiales bacterium]
RERGSVVAGTLARSGLFDLSPRFEPRARGYTVVHFACNVGPLAPGAASVLTVHDLLHRRRLRGRDRLRGALLERCLRRAGRVVAISGRTAAAVGELVPELRGRVEVVPHGLRRRTVPQLPREHVLAFGGVDPRKRVDLAVEAYRAYRASAPDPLPLVVLARAGLSAGRRQALAGLGARIIADATREEADALMAGAAALLHTSAEEGFGLPVLEAAESATPVVLDADAQLADEVVGPHCHRVEDTGPSAWAAALRRAIEAGPVPGALDLPGWAEVARRYRQLYQEVA